MATPGLGSVKQNICQSFPQVILLLLTGLEPASETGGRGFNPRRGQQHSFVEIEHEIFSTVILSLPLIQEGQLSVSGERMCIILVNCLEDYACPVNVWLGKLTALDMTPLGWLGRKTSTQTDKLTGLDNLSYVTSNLSLVDIFEKII